MVVPPDVQLLELTTASPEAPSTRSVPESVFDVRSVSLTERVFAPEPVRSMTSMPLIMLPLVPERPTVTPEPSTRMVSVPVPPWS